MCLILLCFFATIHASSLRSARFQDDVFIALLPVFFSLVFMAAALLITLRETLEASLVIGIVLALLQRTQHRYYERFVWGGVAAGVAGSLGVAWIFQTFLEGFEGRREEIFEGVIMLLAAALITWMIVWMARQGKHVHRHIEQSTHGHIAREHPMGIFFLVFASVLREGVETVIFLRAAFLQSQSSTQHLGAILGIVLAVGASWLLFRGIRTVSLSLFFRLTGTLLLLFAAGLVAHGVHELQEAAVIPLFVEHVWDTNHWIDENGSIGMLLKGVFGYNGNPSLLEILAYGIYIVLGFTAWRSVRLRQSHA